ncbi:MAG: ERAP1-like C-terminal domain-containing protein [Chloroflexota bacterium]
MPALVGLPVPAFVFPNHEDHDYAKVMLDPVSLAFARERLDDLDDPFARQLVWTSLWDMVRDARLRSTEYLAMVRRHAPRETDVALLDAVLEQAVPVLRRYVPEHRIEDEARGPRRRGPTRGVGDGPGGGRPSGLAAVRHRGRHDARGRGRARGPRGCGRGRRAAHRPGDALGVAVKAVALGLPGAGDRAAAERARDGSDRGQREAIRASVSAPDASVKDAAWGRIHAEGYGSDYLTRSALAGFAWRSQRDLLEPWREPFFERVRGVYRERDLGFAHAYLRWLYPATWGEPEVVERSSRLLDDLGPDEVPLRRHLMEARDDLERVIRVRAFLGGRRRLADVRRELGARAQRATAARGRRDAPPPRARPALEPDLP